MILNAGLEDGSIETCPHTRGDDPEPLHNDSEGDMLVPTRVGMILSKIRTAEM